MLGPQCNVCNLSVVLMLPLCSGLQAHLLMFSFPSAEQLQLCNCSLHHETSEVAPYSMMSRQGHPVRSRQRQRTGTSHTFRLTLGRSCFMSQLRRLALRILRAWEEACIPVAAREGRLLAPCISQGNTKVGEKIKQSLLVVPGAHPRRGRNLARLGHKRK